MKRRTLLSGGGALVVGLAWPGARSQGNLPLPGSLKAEPYLDGWIRLDPAGAITVCTGKAELGQGIRTALLQVAAEELMVEPSRITLIGPDTERTPNEGYTAGSHSMQDSATAIRHAAAQVRALLVAAATRQLAVSPDALTLRDGVISGGGRSMPYGALVDSVALHAQAVPTSPLRPPGSHVHMGRPLARIDIPAKVTGGSAYVHDLRMDGMVHGRVVRPPNAGAMLVAVDTTVVAAMPGVVQVVRDGRFLAVVAQREFQAVAAQRALAAATRWDRGPAVLPAPADLYASLLRAPARDEVILGRGTLDATITLQAEYRRPYQMHGSIGPSCAVAHAVDGKTTVWTHTQGVYPLRKALAELLGVQLPQVRCIHMEGAGCYGHNGADDVAADAALLARAMPGRPVRVQWMREDEHGSEPLGPPMLTRASATLDAGGMIRSWRYELWSNTHNGRPGGAGDLLAGQHLDRPFAPTPPKPIPQPEGGGDRNAIPLYTLPAARVTHHFLPLMPLRVSALRSLGAYVNVYSIESFMDELAAQANADPVAFRLRHMTDARAIDVIRLAAERFGWETFSRSPRRGRGFGFARYKNLGAYAAIACEIEVWRETGELRIARVVAAVDSGEAVNLDGIRNQIEGGIVQSASWTTLEEASFDRQGVTARDWGAYPILRFPQVPGRVDVHVIDRPGLPFLGTGEAAQGPMAAAIANAFADATGVRLRTLPFSRNRVRAALGEPAAPG